MARFILYITVIYLSLSYAVAGHIDSVYIGGTIKNYKLKYIAFSYTHDYLYFKREVFYVAQTDKEGNFDLSFKWERPWPLLMTIDEKVFTLFLGPGDSLQIRASYGNLNNSMTYSKNAGPGHNILFHYQREFTRKNQEFRSKLLKLDSLAFITMNDQNLLEQHAFLEKDSLNGINKNFHEFLNALVDYNYFNNIFEYCHAKRRYLDSTYMNNKFDRKHVNNEYALPLIEYVIFLENYISWQGDIRKSIERSSANFWNYRFNISKKLLLGGVRDLILARTVKKAFVYANHITAMTLYNDFSNNCGNRSYLNQIKKNFIH